MESPVSSYVLPYIEELDIPNQDVVIDYGGSLIKLMYKPKQILGDKQDQQRCPLAVAIFPPDVNLEGMAEFIKQNAQLSEDNGSIHSTGVGLKKHGPELEKLLNKKIILQAEMDCFNKALKCVFAGIKQEDMFYKLPVKEFHLAVQNANAFKKMTITLREKALTETTVIPDMAISEINAEQLYSEYGAEPLSSPSIVAMCSSGFAIGIYNGAYNTVAYSSRCGRTLMGLGCLLTGEKNYEDMIKLAEKGDNSQVDTYIKHLRGADTSEDFYSLFPDECLTFNFGRAYGKTLSDFKKEDVAAAVVALICTDLAQTVQAVAQKHKVKEIVLAGTMISHEIVRKGFTVAFLTEALMFPPEERPTLRMCKVGPYLGTIGAWLYGKH